MKPNQVVLKTMKCLSVLALLSGITTGLIGCGYSTHNLIRNDIQSVAIPVWDNETHYTGLEVDLTKALVKEVKLHTSLRIEEHDSAESNLDGTIVSYEDDIADRTEDEKVLLRRGTVTVRFTWTDNYTGQKILSDQELTESETFALGRSEDIAKKLFEETAEKIIQKLEEDW